MRPRLHTAARRRAGFTVMELAAVILILGMMTYTVRVSFESLVPGERLNSSVRELADTLRQARSEAASRNQEYFVEYDLENARFRIVTPYLVGGDGQRWIEDVHHEEDRYLAPWINLRPGVEFGSLYLAGEVYAKTLVRVRFDPLGAASDHSVTLQQPEYESKFTIEVLALTGLIRMHDGDFFRELPDDGDFD
jgi:Tfp pilus assembly protein FimT